MIETESGIKINVGSGGFQKEGWINLDLPSGHYEKMQKSIIPYDLMRLEKLPFEDNSVDTIYSSHVIEHIPNFAALNLFKEAHRVLKHNGVFRVTCPNADLFYYAALREDTQCMYRRREQWFRANGILDKDLHSLDFLVKAIASRRNPRCLVLNKKESDITLNLKEVKINFLKYSKEEFFDWLVEPLEFSINHVSTHLNWWNYDKLKSAFIDAGFNIVSCSSCGASVSSSMRDLNDFDNTVPYESIYIEAIKTV